MKKFLFMPNIELRSLPHPCGYIRLLRASNLLLFLSAVASLRRHPQLCVDPRRRFTPSAVNSHPQSHRTRQVVMRLSVRSSMPRTVSLQKRLPVRSMKLLACFMVEEEGIEPPRICKVDMYDAADLPLNYSSVLRWRCLLRLHHRPQSVPGSQLKPVLWENSPHGVVDSFNISP